MVNDIKNNLQQLLCFENFLKKNKNNIVFLCVGNSDVWYDSFGPIVGDLLINKYNIKSFVYGNSENNIKLSNLNEYVDWVNKKHCNCKIIVIDAALSKNKNFNRLVFKKGKTKCAYYSSLSREVGDYSVLYPVKIEFRGNEETYYNLIEKALLVSEIINKYIV